MSAISQYVSSLLPGFNRGQIEEDIRILKETVTQNSIPLYSSMSEHFATVGFKSKDVVDFNNTFKKRVGTSISHRGEMLNIILDQLKNTLDVLNDLDNDLNKYFSKEITKSGMNYTHTNILRYLETCHFNFKYATQLLFWLMGNEQSAGGQKLPTPLTATELTWVYENRNNYFVTVKLLSMEPRKVKGLFKDIPNMVVVPSEVSVVEATVGASKVDPLGMNILPIKLNPIYHIGMVIAEYQATRHKASVEQKRSLEYRLLAIKELNSGKRDPKLEQEIEYTENRIKKLNYKIAKLEEE